MTLKEILKCWKSQNTGDSTHANYHIPTLESDLEKLIEEVFKKACLDYGDFYFEDEINDAWQENKSKFLG